MTEAKMLRVLVNALAVSDPCRSAVIHRNFGRTSPVAGLDTCNCGDAIPIDVDLQDPIEFILHLIEVKRLARIWCWLSAQTAQLTGGEA